jgi:hypothetical protein
MLITPDLTSLPEAPLPESIMSLREQRDAITAATDVLFFGI